MVFVFYQFEPPPVSFNRVAWEGGLGVRRRRAPAVPRAAVQRSRRRDACAVEDWLRAREYGDRPAEAGGAVRALDAHGRGQAVRAEAKAALESLNLL